MTPKFKVGDIVAWEHKNKNENAYFLITKLFENNYDVKDLSTGVESQLDINVFEKECGYFKETRLITDEEKLDLL